MLFDVIRYEPTDSNWLVYKHPADQFNTKSKLIVAPGQVALMVHNGKIEKVVENGTFPLTTEFYPLLKTFINLVHGNKNAYPLEVYFINKITKPDFLWGTSEPIDLLDPKFKINIRLRARGQMGLTLVSYQLFFKNYVGTLMKGKLLEFSILATYFKGIINQRIREVLSSYILDKHISYFEIAKHMDEITELFSAQITAELNQFGFVATNVSIESINVPQDNLVALNQILNTKAEYEQLGDDTYRITKGYNILEKAASNNSTATTVFGMGMGMNMNNNVNTIIPEVKGTNKTGEHITCFGCHNSIAKGSKFCPHCGAKLELKCQCGAVIKFGCKFCSECGKEVKNA